ncbi:MAG: arginine--tRNA ligase [Nitrospirota bacterium]|nr:arginine--tRNA ligase [Nitrospirota bacterium]
MENQINFGKSALINLIAEALAACRADGLLTGTITPKILLENPKHEGQGDFATTISLMLAKIEKKAPRAIAEILVIQLEGQVDWIEKIEIAGPGYINFFLSADYWLKILPIIHEGGPNFGCSLSSKKEKILIEFVSANPTGPLHVASGRAAALGDALANLLKATGHSVDREYYLNDIGVQVSFLGRSTYLRYRELFGEAVILPEGSYQGDYIIDIAKALKTRDGDIYLKGPESEHLPFFTQYSLHTIIAWIKEDMRRFGINFDRWFSEKTLEDHNEVEAALKVLDDKKMLLEKEGARWLASTTFGDDKDRVVVRSNGQTTYFASDIAYHLNKFDRGYDRLIDIWGADHHGYVMRIKAAVQALGYEAKQVNILIHQLVNLLRDGKPIKMSKRAGTFVRLREVMDEVGVDATRFFFLMRRSDSSLDFDLELAKKATNENPVFYVQYAHARLCSIMRVAKEKGWHIDEVIQNTNLDTLRLLTLPSELSLVRELSQYPALIKAAAETMEPHRVPFYLQTLAGLLHSYYFACRVVTDDKALTAARLVLVTAVRIVLQNGLKLLGISAPEKM